MHRHLVTIGQTPAFVASMMIRWSEQKPRERQANSRMPRVLAAQDKVVQYFKEEDAMKPSTKDQAEGKFHEVKGKIKEKLGKATKNTNIENEGTSERVAGKVQKKIGQVEKVLGD